MIIATEDDMNNLTNEQKKAVALAMADRLEFLAGGLDKAGMSDIANVNRAKAAQIRAANK
jgi:hypothetical protein